MGELVTTATKKRDDRIDIRVSSDLKKRVDNRISQLIQKNRTRLNITDYLIRLMEEDLERAKTEK